MAEPIEVRVRPHHHEGDVVVGHVEFPDGLPGGGDSVQTGSAFSAWVDAEVPPDGNATVIPLGSLDYVQGFDLEAGDDHVDAPAGAYIVRLGLRTDFDTVTPSTGFVFISMSTYWTDDDSNEVSDALAYIQFSSANPPNDPAFDSTLAGSPVVQKFGINVLPKDGRLQLEVTNNTELPVYVRGQVVVGRV